jgi:hypothetical protein
MISEEEEAIYAQSMKTNYNFRKEVFEDYKPKKYYTIPEDEQKLQAEKD